MDYQIKVGVNHILFPPHWSLPGGDQPQMKTFLWVQNTTLSTPDKKQSINCNRTAPYLQPWSPTREGIQLCSWSVSRAAVWCTTVHHLSTRWLI